MIGLSNYSADNTFIFYEFLSECHLVYGDHNS